MSSNCIRCTYIVYQTSDLTEYPAFQFAKSGNPAAAAAAKSLQLCPNLGDILFHIFSYFFKVNF